MRALRGFLMISVVLGIAAPAVAETFDQMSDRAVRVSGDTGLAALFWSQTSSCSRYKNDVYRRQCEGIRQARRKQVTSSLYLVDTEASITTGPYDAKKKSMPLAIRACISCSGEMKVKGKKRYVVARKGRVSAKNGAVVAPEVHATTRTFRTKEAAEAWKKQVLPRLRSQFLVRLPDRLDSWNRGYKVEVLGYRVFDPCKGTILHAKPTSRSARQDVSTCPKTDDSDKPKKVVEPKPADRKPAEPKLPERLTTAQIASVLAPVRKAGPRCYDTYGVAGTAKVRLSFNGDGKITSLSLSGEFKDTPTGKCVLKAAEGLQFPKSRKKSTTLTYPVNVR